MEAAMTEVHTPRKRFRQLLSERGIIMAPGAYDCLTAKIIEQAGFPAVYMTGAGTSVARLGYPDLGLATMTEMVANAANIVSVVDVPVIADADTGYGGVLNVQRTVRQYEQAGVAAIHIEDQESPKRCGHLDDKRVIPTAEMVQKIRAAVDARRDEDFVIIVRTDALAVTDWDDTMRRCEAYVEAGAEVLFVEALRSAEEARRVTSNFGVPLLYNFVETGKSPLIPADELEALGFKLVIFPGSAFMLVCKAVEELMGRLKQQGTTVDFMDRMASLNQSFEMVGLSDMLAQDAKYAEVNPARVL
jgi:methylisocitrate lyase